MRLSLAPLRWLPNLTAWLWRVSAGLLDIRMAELSSSVNGPESATASFSGRFSTAVGYGPKMFQSVLRFQRLLNFAGRPHTHLPFADLAAVAGYADQAHMTREVGRFANWTPTILLPSAECTLRLSDLFKTDDPLADYFGDR